MRCSCRLETMRSWLWHPNQSHLVTLQLCIARQTWIQNSNDQDSERDLKIGEQISRLYDWRPVLYIGMLKHSNFVACYIEPRVSLYCAGFLTATRMGWQHSHLIDLSSSARHTSVSLTTTPAYLTKCQQSIRSKWQLPADCRASRPNTDSVTSQCHGLRHPSPPWFSLFSSVTCYWRRHAAGLLSRHFASLEPTKMGRLSSKRVPSVTSDARLAVMGWATGICLEPTWDLNNCFRWTQEFKEKKSKSNAKNCVFKDYPVKMDKTALPVTTIQIITGRDKFLKGLGQPVSDFDFQSVFSLNVILRVFHVRIFVQSVPGLRNA